MRKVQGMKKSKKKQPSVQTVGDIIEKLNFHAPLAASESWDNVGLLVGDPDWKTSGAVVAIDLSAEAIELAKKRGYRLIINHHPCIFPKSKGISRVLAHSGKTGLVFEAIRSGIAVACYHTNFDRCALEVVHSISSEMGLNPLGRLHEKSKPSLTKLSVFVPLTHQQKVRDALTAAGAGQVGNYDSCTFSQEGEGTFRGALGTRPFLGKPGFLEKVREVRIETIFPTGMDERVLRALRASHPYEEIAYDLYPLEQRPQARGLVKGLGYGFWGDFKQSKSFSELIKSVRSVFGTNGFLLTHPGLKQGKAAKFRGRVQRVAFAAGNGGSFVEAAASQGCDLMITGEADYHQVLAVSTYGGKHPMGVLLLGHRESEKYFVDTLKSWLSDAGVKSIGLHLETQRFCF